MMQKIDRMPPEPSGDLRRDLGAVYEYLFYLREQFNFILYNMDKKEADHEQ